MTTYDDYGRPGGSAPTRFGFTGHVALAEAGLVHMRARAYDPGTGRFLSPDPIGYGDGPNLYAYAGGDPVNRVDLTGLKFVRVCVGVDVSHMDCGWRYYPEGEMLGIQRAGPAPTRGEAPSSGSGGGNGKSQGPVANDICNTPVDTRDGKSRSVNERRREVRKELSEASKYHPGAPSYQTAGNISFVTGINAARLSPGGSWDTTKVSGNPLYGAVLSELGFPDWASLGIAHGLEILEYIGLKTPNDPFEPLDTPAAQEQIKDGIACKG